MYNPFPAQLARNHDNPQRQVGPRSRYHFGEGNDLWLVFNEGFNTERHQPFGPMLPVTDSRAILLKYTYTFIW